MNRNSISLNIARQLWANSGGHCQNPRCNGYLFAGVGDNVVSLANVAHIIGHGKNGPRSEHELAEVIDKDGLDNLVMLCLSCHKIVDELEKQFGVEEMQGWKSSHEEKVRGLFDVPRITDERELLAQVNDLLDANGLIFKEYGPLSIRAVEGDSGDALTVWRRRCLDTILPNNQRIVRLIEKNKRNFPYPWDVYKQMCGYKLHADAFQDNCLLGQKVNDYKLFPIEFDHFVKSKLGISTPPLEVRCHEDLEFRWNQVSRIIERFLVNHSFIENLEEVDATKMTVMLKDGRILRVFVTHTYYVTAYTFEKVMAFDPEIDAILCSNPYGQYSLEAKRICIENRVGLFHLGEFMGALRKSGDEFLNYLLKADRDRRIQSFIKALRGTPIASGLKVFLFGSYLRAQIYRDIDVVVVYSDRCGKEAVYAVKESLVKAAKAESSELDLTVCSAAEFARWKLEYDNLTLIYG